MARNKTPQSYAKRKREIEKRRKREEKLERKLDRSYWKRVAKDPSVAEKYDDWDGGNKEGEEDSKSES